MLYPKSSSEVHDLFDPEHISSWKEALRLLDYHQLQTYIQQDSHKNTQEFRNTVNHVFLTGHLSQEPCLIRVLKDFYERYREEVVCAILEQREHNPDCNHLRELCEVMIPTASVNALKVIYQWPAGCLALRKWLCENPSHSVDAESTARWSVNLNAPWVHRCGAFWTANQNNYDLWLERPLEQRINIACRGGEMWEIWEYAYVKPMDLLQLIEDERSKLQRQWDSAISEMKRPKIRHSEKDEAENHTLVNIE